MFHLSSLTPWRKKARSFFVLGLLIAPLVFAASPGCMSEGGGGGGGGDGDDSSVPTVQGKIELPQRLVLDYDTNDPNNNPSSNNNFNKAQPVDNLITVVGFAGVNIPADPEGNPHPDDPADVYKLHLKKDEKLSLRIANPDIADLDLKLYDQGTSLVDSSTSTDQAVEEVTVTTGGTYYVKVFTKDGGSNYSIYNLAVGVSSASAPASWSVSQDFVIGQAVVKFKQDKKIAAQDMHALALKKAAGMNASLKEVDPRGLALLQLGADGGGPLKRLGGGFGKSLQSAYPGDVIKAKKETLDRIRDISKGPAVAYAEPNFIYQPAALSPNDEHFHLQWDKPAMHCGLAWDKTTGNSDVVIAVVDSGVLYDHPDLDANILRDGGNVVGYDMIENSSIARDGDGRDPNPYDVGDLGLQGGGSSFHGTHVAGIAAAVGDNSEGIAGASWNTSIMPVRALGKGGGTAYDVAQSILYAAGVSNVSGSTPAVPADIINLSLGGPTSSSAVENAVNKAWQNDVIVVAAAGNDATNANYYPVAYPHVVGVSATDYRGNLAPYSNYGNYIDLAAPGGDKSHDYNNDGYQDGILSTFGDDSGCSLIEKEGPKTCIEMIYDFYQGTSMAAPNVAGVVALMLDAYYDQSPADDFTPYDLEQIIKGQAGSTIPSITNYEKGFWEPEKGYGIIDADRAVEAARILGGATPDPTPRLVADPNALSFGFDLNRLDLYLSNRGTNPVTGLTVESYDGSTWLSHTPLDSSTIAGNSTLTMSFNVHRDQVDENGIYATRVTISSIDGGTDGVSINMSVGDQVGSNAGVVYVILTRADTLETVSQDMTSFGESYQFAVPVQEGGAYYLAAGTDLDDDYSLGDNGELFGLYPNLDQPKMLNLNKGETVTGKDFTLQFVGTPVSSTEPAVLGKQPDHKPLRRMR